MSANDDKIAALEREIEKLKAASAPTRTPTKEEIALEADRVHQAREARANAHTFLSPAQLREMEAACDPATARDLWQHETVQSPSGAGTSGRVVGVHAHGGANVPGGGSGWAREIPLGPPPGVAQSDRLMDAADKADRIELAQRLAAQELARRAMKK